MSAACQAKFSAAFPILGAARWSKLELPAQRDLGRKKFTASAI